MVLWSLNDQRKPRPNVIKRSAKITIVFRFGDAMKTDMELFRDAMWRPKRMYCRAPRVVHYWGGGGCSWDAWLLPGGPPGGCPWMNLDQCRNLADRLMTLFRTDRFWHLTCPYFWVQQMRLRCDLGRRIFASNEIHLFCALRVKITFDWVAGA